MHFQLSNFSLFMTLCMTWLLVTHGQVPVQGETTTNLMMGNYLKTITLYELRESPKPSPKVCNKALTILSEYAEYHDKAIDGEVSLNYHIGQVFFRRL
jgi:hypothetical protein